MKVIAVNKDEKGVISEYQLDNNQVIDKETAISMVEKGEIEGCNISVSKKGTKSIRSKRNNGNSYNLRDLPKIK